MWVYILYGMLYHHHQFWIWESARWKFSMNFINQKSVFFFSTLFSNFICQQQDIWQIPPAFLSNHSQIDAQYIWKPSGISGNQMISLEGIIVTIIFKLSANLSDSPAQRKAGRAGEMSIKNAMQQRTRVRLKRKMHLGILGPFKSIKGSLKYSISVFTLLVTG